MNPFAYTSLAVSICSLVLSIFVFSIAKTKLHRIWATFNLTVFLWSISTFFVAISDLPTQAEIAWRFAYGLGALVPPTFYYFTHIFCELKNIKIVYILYLIGIVFVPINLLSNNFINELFLFSGLYYNKATTFYSIFIIYLSSLVGLSFKELLLYYRNTTGHKKNQCSYLLWGFAIGWSGGFATFLPAYNILIYPVWNIVVCFYAILMTYAIFKFQLLEIQIFIKKGIVYTLLVSFLTINYLVLIFISEKFLRDTYGYQSFNLSIICALLLGIILNPLKNRLQYFVDYYLFKGTPEELAEQNNALRREITNQEKHKAVAALASNIVHELKNPLTALKTFHEYLPERKNDPEFMKKFEAIGANELGRLEKLSRELLDFAKPSPLNLAATDINLLITETLNLLHSQLSKRQIEVKTNLSTTLPSIKVDKNQIKQVLINLVTNAIEAMPNGGKLTIETETKRNFIQIHIEDTGCGIPTEDLRHIFEPFFSKKDGGTGLGLAICQQIISEHHGKILVRSELGKGTIFQIFLPDQIT